MLYAALQQIAEQYPEHRAVADSRHTLTYADLWQSSAATARRLQDQGVQRGDRVCLLTENSCDAVVLYWAILRCQAIAVWLNEKTPVDGIERILDDAGPALLVLSSSLKMASLKPRPGCTIVALSALVIDQSEAAIDAEPEAAIEAPAELPADEHLIASIIYTSGSTGKPKGVCLTHANLAGVATMAGDGYHTVPSDSYLMVVPLHYIHGLMILMTMHLRGAAILFMNSFAFPAAVTRTLQSSEVTGFSGVPFHFTALIERGGFLEANFPHLRWVGVTGGTIAVERLRQIRTAQPDLEIHISYGQTECSPRITALDPSRIDTKPCSVGSVAKGLEVSFLDEEGVAVDLGEVGELVVAGRTVMHGYWNDEKNTRRVIDTQGRLHTGDLAYIDEDGDVFIKGRLQAMIKAAGERIFPEELEWILNQSPEVVDVAVIGRPDPLYGQVVEAHVVLRDPSDEGLERVRKHCLSHVAFARSPRHYRVWEALPLMANGKTDRQQLLSSEQ